MNRSILRFEVSNLVFRNKEKSVNGMNLSVKSTFLPLFKILDILNSSFLLHLAAQIFVQIQKLLKLFLWAI